MQALARSPLPPLVKKLAWTTSQNKSPIFSRWFKCERTIPPLKGGNAQALHRAHSVTRGAQLLHLLFQCQLLQQVIYARLQRRIRIPPAPSNNGACMLNACMAVTCLSCTAPPSHSASAAAACPRAPAAARPWNTSSSGDPSMPAPDLYNHQRCFFCGSSPALIASAAREKMQDVVTW